MSVHCQENDPAIGELAGRLRGARCSFVLSTGRTGTASLAALLGLSPDVRATHEPHPPLWEVSKAAFERSHQEPRRFAEIFVEARAAPILAARQRNQLYAETSYRMTFLATAIAQILPDVRFLHLYRHPAAVVRSGMRRGWYASSRYDAYRISPSTDDIPPDQWASWDAFSKICWYWTAVNQLALRLRAGLPKNQVFPLRSEDLFDPRSGVVERLFKFLQLDPPPQKRVTEVLARRLNQQPSGRFPEFSEWTTHQQQTLVAIAGDTMAALGYSPVFPSQRPGVDEVCADDKCATTPQLRENP